MAFNKNFISNFVEEDRPCAALGIVEISVFRVWEETDDYYFFAFRENGFTAFDQTLGEAWHRDNYFRMIEKAENTVSQYENAVNAIKDTDMVYGNYIDLVFQNEVEFLDLTENRFEVKSSQNRSE